MRGVRTALGALLVVCALIAVAAASAKSDAVAKKDKEPVAKHGGHILWTPQLKQQFGLRKQAMQTTLNTHTELAGAAPAVMASPCPSLPVDGRSRFDALVLEERSVR